MSSFHIDREWKALMPRSTLILSLLAALAAPSVTLGQSSESRPPSSRVGAAPLVWPECRPGQVQVLILGTFHFEQTEQIDVLDSARQAELASILDGLEAWEPGKIAVEYPHASQSRLDSTFAAYLGRPESEPGSPNEIAQVGFRLARRLGHDRVHAADVPINLWDDSIRVFDERWPRSREGLRARWPERYAEGEEPSPEMPLARILEILNTDAVPGNSEMYAGFLPLVEEEIYAGALKLRPWYDRNLRIVQNLFRIADPAGDRLVLVIGSGHLRVLKQILELTPQLCPVSAIPVLARSP
jgi:hypothetical protein